MFQRSGVVAALMAAFVLTACGGGGPSVSAVKVVGDSLADSGTFGFKFTVQGNPIWTDLVADALGAPALCARYAGSSPENVALNPAKTDCTSYAVGGARINPAGGAAADNSPLSVIQQIRTLAAEQPVRPGELLLVDGGGNDVADLFGAYSRGPVVFKGLLSELLSPQEAETLHTNAPVAGSLYMSRLADRLVNALEQQVLQRGARRVAVVNVPDVTVTPRFLRILDGVSMAQGPQAAAGLKELAGAWVKAFNDRLAARLAKAPQVTIVDFNGLLNQWVSQPAAFGLTNVTDPVCPNLTPTGPEPTYFLGACTEGLLNKKFAGDGWKTYVFSDNFHGTPKTNELVADAVLEALMAKAAKALR